ncbi:hypothetical protein RIF29_19519 [Crotalaria pallida]|uniref:Uncharacterized protein n=1 Tax=Crotalaria pallida TaxID=3830 RepID=A0AAN9IBH3_CROPI
MLSTDLVSRRGRSRGSRVQNYQESTDSELDIFDNPSKVLEVDPGLEEMQGTSTYGLNLLDLPGIIEGAKDGKGRGRQTYYGTVDLISLCFMALEEVLDEEDEKLTSMKEELGDEVDMSY